MSRTFPLGIAVVALLLTSPLPGIAQQTEAEMMQRLDSLRPLLRDAEAAYEALEVRLAEAARRHAAAEAQVDTLHVGMITIITPLEQVETARELFTEVWDEHFSTIEYSPALESALFAFQWSHDQVPIHIDNHRRSVEMTRWARRSRVKDQIRSAVAATLNYDLRALDTNVARWVSGDPLQGHDMEKAYRVVATTESQATRSCLAGDISGCVSALGLDGEESPEQLEVWYTPAERRSLVARLRYLANNRDNAEGWARCVEDEILEWCDRLLREDRRGQRWAPMPGSVRETLLSYALQRGGPGAWGRLLEHPEMEATEAMAYASALPLDELVAGWRLWLIENRPVTHEGALAKSGLALLWTIFFAALAVRSTRWRLG